jgi:guanylate kinase
MNRLFVIAAPSGAGKTSLIHELRRRDSNLRMCVSHTTRPRRATEVDGDDYHFTDVAHFESMIAADAFLEYARVFDHYYGTSRAALTTAFEGGHDVILEIDWQGARQVRSREPSCATLFVLPPSRAELERRLRSRRTDSDAVIARRLRDAVDDMSHYREFDYVIVNAEFERAVADAREIIAGRGTALRADRPELAPLLAELLA